jgi:putative transposase
MIDGYENALAERVNGILKSEFWLQRSAELGAGQAAHGRAVGGYLPRRAAASVAEIATPEPVYR